MMEFQNELASFRMNCISVDLFDILVINNLRMEIGPNGCCQEFHFCTQRNFSFQVSRVGAARKKGERGKRLLTLEC